ncbi:MAG TPA: hypothetical protein V6D48_13130 [Oculatellaceae cyanobacterium]
MSQRTVMQYAQNTSGKELPIVGLDTLIRLASGKFRIFLLDV